MQPSSCDTFVALPPATVGNRIIFGKNSDRLCDEVQEVIYFPAAVHNLGEHLKCTYIEIDQVPETYAVVLSRPAWLWGAEMGANEHGVCIGNEAVWGREAVCDEEALLGMDLVRLGLERADTAEKALNVIVDLLEKYGQGGNCTEGTMEFSYHNSFLIADRTEAWILETAGRYWAAEKVQGVRNISNQLSITTKINREHPDMKNYAKQKSWWDGKKEFDFAAVYSYLDTAKMMTSSSRYCEGYKLLNQHKGNITFETMMEILRDKRSGINMEGEFMTTASMVSVLPQDPSLPCIHFFTGTPDPDRSVFKPFIFVPHISQLLDTISPTFELEDPVKKKPHFKSKPDRRHPLYQKHQQALEIIDNNKEKGKTLLDNMRKLETELFKEIESILENKHLDVDKIVNLFSQSTKDEIRIYKSNISS
ncbi:secernin-3 isoform X2 [Lepus europaeus]|uniref:secernin-3 isoform X2 n=1 Tax=Lepus europaeus TaxID=9983 RepID=UPI002B46840F|nr:secernin-3 isoform X2 [Lepus europaeus]